MRLARIEMRLEGPIGWLVIAVSALLVLLIPTALVFTTSGWFFYSCLLGMAFDASHGGLPMAPGARAWLGVVLALIPGVLFARETQVRRLTRPIGRLAVFMMLLTFLMPLSLSWPRSSFRVIPGTSVDLYFISSSILPATALLILLPVLIREARILSGIRNWPLTNELEDDLEAPVHYRRNLILVLLFWLVILAGPLTYGLAFLGSTLPMVFLLGLYYNFQIISTDVFTDPSLGITMVMNGPSQFIVVLLLSSVRLIFVRDVFSFFWGPVSVRRLITIGFLGEMLPFITIYLLPLLLSGVSAAGLAFPFPLTPLFGFIFLRLFKPVSEDSKADAPLIGKEQHTFRESPPAPDTVQVPLAYLLRSKLAAVVKRERRHAQSQS